MATRPSVLGGGLLKGVQELNRGLEAQIAQENQEAALLQAADRIALQERQVEETEKQNRITNGLALSAKMPGVFTMDFIANDMPEIYEVGAANGLSPEALAALPLTPETFAILADREKMALIADDNPNSQRWKNALIGGLGFYSDEEAATISSGAALSAEAEAERNQIYLDMTDAEKRELQNLFHFSNSEGEAWTFTGAEFLARQAIAKAAGRAATGSARATQVSKIAEDLQEEMASAATINGEQIGERLPLTIATNIAELILTGGDEAEAALMAMAANPRNNIVVARAIEYALFGNLSERNMTTEEMATKHSEMLKEYADLPGLSGDLIRIFTSLGLYNTEDGSFQATPGGMFQGPGLGYTPRNPTQSGQRPGTGYVTPAEEDRVRGDRPVTDGPERVPFDQLTPEMQELAISQHSAEVKAMTPEERAAASEEPGGAELIERAMAYVPPQINPNVDTSRLGHAPATPTPAPADTTTQPTPEQRLAALQDAAPPEAAPDFDGVTPSAGEAEVRSELMAEDLAAIPPRGSDRKGFIKNKTDVFTSAVASVAPLSGMILKEMSEQSGSLAGITPDTVWRELVARLGTPGTSSDRRAAGTKFTAAIRGLATKIGRTSDPTRLQKAFEEAVQDIREAEVALNSIREG